MPSLTYDGSTSYNPALNTFRLFFLRTQRQKVVAGDARSFILQHLFFLHYFLYFPGVAVGVVLQGNSLKLPKPWRLDPLSAVGLERGLLQTPSPT